MAGNTALYVIELEPDQDPDAQWYVGVSKHPERRFNAHKIGNGADWTARNTVVDMYIVGWETREFVHRMESHLTEVMMHEFGPESTRGGGRLQAELPKVPDGSSADLHPALATALEDVDHPELSKLAGYGTVHIEFEQNIRVSDAEEAFEWVDTHLPTGTEATVKSPSGEPAVTVVSRDPDESSQVSD